MERHVWIKELGLIERALSDLREALNELPQENRQAFLLYRICGFTLEQIADFSGRDLLSVERGICQAIAHLEHKLFHQHQPQG